MSLTLHLPPDLERSLQEEARRAGVDPETFVLEALRSRLHRTHSVLSSAEAELLEKINYELPAAFLHRYYELIEKRHAQTLTEEEHRELIASTAEVQRCSAQRLGYLAALARLRGVSLDELIDQLGIRSLSAL